MALPTLPIEMIEASAHPARRFIQSPQFKQTRGTVSAESARGQPAPQPVLILFPSVALAPQSLPGPFCFGEEGVLDARRPNLHQRPS
jgi:hypothetical protein